MKTTEISLMRRRNLGNYEHIESSVTIALDEGDKESLAVEKAKVILNKALGYTKEEEKKTVSAKTEKPVEEKKEEEPKKSPAKKKAPVKKKAPAKKAASVPKATKEDVLKALRSYAEAHQSKEMAQAVLKETTKAEKLADVDPKDYGKLVKALEV